MGNLLEALIARLRGSKSESNSDEDLEKNQVDVQNIITDFGSVLDWKKYNRKNVKDDLKYELKGTAYLMTGHAAGLVGCLTFLKDFDPAKLQALYFLHARCCCFL